MMNNIILVDPATRKHFIDAISNISDDYNPTYLERLYNKLMRDFETACSDVKYSDARSKIRNRLNDLNFGDPLDDYTPDFNSIAIHNFADDISMAYVDYDSDLWGGSGDGLVPFRGTGCELGDCGGYDDDNYLEMAMSYAEALRYCWESARLLDEFGDDFDGDASDYDVNQPFVLLDLEDCGFDLWINTDSSLYSEVVCEDGFTWHGVKDYSQIVEIYNSYKSEVYSEVA